MLYHGVVDPAMPTVSVLIPSFNHARFLGACLQSVIDQTWTDWEIVFVDDGSSDESVALARGIDDPRIRVFVNETNLGTYGTLNRALDLAEGEFVAILNSDDFWAPAKLERQLGALSSNAEASFSYTFGTTTDEQGVPKADSHHQGLPSEPIQNPICSLVVENRILASSVVFRRGAIRFEPTLPTSGDWLALIELCRQGPAAYVDQPLTFWRHHGTNTSRQLLRAVLDEARIRRMLLADALDWRLPLVDPDALRKSLAVCAVRYHATALLLGDGAEARRALRLARKLDPRSRTYWRRQALALLPNPVLMRRFGRGVDISALRQEARQAALPVHPAGPSDQA